MVSVTMGRSVGNERSASVCEDPGLLLLVTRRGYESRLSHEDHVVTHPDGFRQQGHAV